MTKTNLFDSSDSEDEESFVLPQQDSTNSTSTSKTNFDFDCAHETPITELPEDLDLEILLQGDEIDSESTKKKLRTIIFESELIPAEIRSNAGSKMNTESRKKLTRTHSCTSQSNYYYKTIKLHQENLNTNRKDINLHQNYSHLNSFYQQFKSKNELTIFELIYYESNYPDHQNSTNLLTIVPESIVRYFGNEIDPITNKLKIILEKHDFNLNQAINLEQHYVQNLDYEKIENYSHYYFDPFYPKIITNCDILTRHCLYILQDMASAMMYLEKLDIIHCDIKLENIMTNYDFSKFYLIDFDASLYKKDSYHQEMFTTKHPTSNFGTGNVNGWYRPPEYFIGNDERTTTIFQPASDIYSLSVTVIIFLLRRVDIFSMIDSTFQGNDHNGFYQHNLMDFLSNSRFSNLIDVLIDVNLTEEYKWLTEEITSISNENYHQSYEYQFITENVEEYPDLMKIVPRTLSDLLRDMTKWTPVRYFKILSELISLVVKMLRFYYILIIFRSSADNDIF